jgi:hypothetical protein
MSTADVYGFAHDDLDAACRAIESALSISLEEIEEREPPGECFYVWYVPDGPCVQLRRNSGLYQRWQGDPSNPWHLDYGVLVYVHGPAREPIVEALKHEVPGLSFLERMQTM